MVVDGVAGMVVVAEGTVAGETEVGEKVAAAGDTQEDVVEVEDVVGLTVAVAVKSASSTTVAYTDRHLPVRCSSHVAVGVIVLVIQITAEMNRLLR